MAPQLRLVHRCAAASHHLIAACYGAAFSSDKKGILTAAWYVWKLPTASRRQPCCLVVHLEHAAGPCHAAVRAERRQFAAVQGGLLAWDFELKDESGGTLALIDRNFSGERKERLDGEVVASAWIEAKRLAAGAGDEAVSWAASWAVSDTLPWLSLQLAGAQLRSYTFTTASSTRLPPSVSSWGALLSCASDAGFGKELFTDAGKYVIHFGSSPQEAAEQVATAVQAAHPDKPPPPVTALARVRTDVSVIPTSTGARLACSVAVGLVQEFPV